MDNTEGQERKRKLSTHGRTEIGIDTSFRKAEHCFTSKPRHRRSRCVPRVHMRTTAVRHPLHIQTGQFVLLETVSLKKDSITVSFRF